MPYYKGVQHLAPDVLLASWSGQPRVDAPRVGLVTGVPDFLEYVKVTREWLALGDATLRPVGILNTPARSVEEVVVELEAGSERQQLGVAVVAEWDHSHLLTSVRIYHSLWPLFSNQPMHNPLLTSHPNSTLPLTIYDNLQARAAHDVDALLDTYEDDVEVHPSRAGGQVCSGKDQLRRLYRAQQIPGTQPHIEICLVTDDGDTCVVEYHVSHFGEPEPDQVGVTVYERGPSARISRERNYLVSSSPVVGAPQVLDAVESTVGQDRTHWSPAPRRHADLGAGRA